MKLANVPVTIDLSPGVYHMGYDGAIGKTYLYKLLCRQRDFTESEILTVTYESAREETTLLDKVRNFSGSVIILDKLDLYASDALLSEIKGKNCVILIDMKSYKLWRKLPRTRCDVRLEEKGIYVCKK